MSHSPIFLINLLSSIFNSLVKKNQEYLFYHLLLSIAFGGYLKSQNKYKMLLINNNSHVQRWCYTGWQTKYGRFFMKDFKEGHMAFVDVGYKIYWRHFDFVTANDRCIFCGFYFSLLLRSRRKVYQILLNQLLAETSERKVPETWQLYFSIDLAAGKIFCMCVCVCVCAYVCVCVCVCMYVCKHCRGRNFYSIGTKFSTPIA